MESFQNEIAELLEVESVTECDELESFEAWDSLTSLSIIAFIDEKYKVSISSNELLNSKNVGGLKNLIL